MRLAALALVAAFLLAGCASKGPPAPSVDPASSNATNATDFALPVGGRSAAANETNVTEQAWAGCSTPTTTGKAASRSWCTRATCGPR